MPNSRLEHVNLTVTDAHATAAMLHDLFGWQIRWQGDAKNGGYSLHVGSDDDYLAVYTPPKPTQPAPNALLHHGGMNHVGIVVDDLDAVEARVKARGLTPMSHADYEPGRRFYFHDPDGIEFEVVAYV